MKKLQNQHTCQLISAGWKALGKGLFSKELLLTERSLPTFDGGDRVTHGCWKTRGPNKRPGSGACLVVR